MFFESCASFRARRPIKKQATWVKLLNPMLHGCTFGTQRATCSWFCYDDSVLFSVHPFFPVFFFRRKCWKWYPTYVYWTVVPLRALALVPTLPAQHMFHGAKLSASLPAAYDRYAPRNEVNTTLPSGNLTRKNARNALLYIPGRVFPQHTEDSRSPAFTIAKAADIACPEIFYYYSAAACTRCTQPIQHYQRQW